MDLVERCDWIVFVSETGDGRLCIEPQGRPTKLVKRRPKCNLYADMNRAACKALRKLSGVPKSKTIHVACASVFEETGECRAYTLLEAI